MMREEGEHPAGSSLVALTRVPCAGELGMLVAIATSAKMLPPPRAGMQPTAVVLACVGEGRRWGARGGWSRADTAGEAVGEAPRESRWAMRPRCCLPVLPPPAAAAPAIPPSLPASRPYAPVATRCRPALSARGPFSLALAGQERSLTHAGWDPADAGGSSLIPSPCTRGRRATLLRTHLAPGWPGVLGKADRLLPPCPTSWIGLCPCI